ncbi:MAG: FAD-binding oxidoreductase [Hyphomicrobiaceae bacterium]
MSATSGTADIVVIGGGIFGLSLARELAERARRRIVLIERRHLGAGASSRNVTRVRAMQLTPELARLAIACQEKHARLDRELGTATLFWRPGYALVLYDDEEMEIMGRANAMLRREFGLRTELLDRRGTLERVPVLEGGALPVGALYHRDAAVHHDSVVIAYRRALSARGVDVREHTEVTGLLVAGKHVEGVATPTGEIRAPVVVNATGAWSRTISAMAGLDVPNTPLRREAMVTEAVKPIMDTMVTFYRPLEGWFHQTLRGEVVMGVTDPAETPGITLSSSAEFPVRTARHVLAKAPGLAGLHVVRQWAGMYDVTPDRKPTVGPVAARPGLVQMSGCNGRGFLLGPKLGELLAAWLDTGRQPDLLAGFEADRFAEGAPSVPVVADYYAGYRQK